MISRHFRVPPANASAADGRSQYDLFASYLYLTQLQQARCYETAFTQWRRLRSSPAGTMGVLYWQVTLKVAQTSFKSSSRPEHASRARPEL